MTRVLYVEQAAAGTTVTVGLQLGCGRLYVARHLARDHWVRGRPVRSALLPGGDQMGLIATTIVGVVGSVVGGYLGRLIKKPEPGASFHPAGFIMSLVGAIVVLLAWRMVR